MTYRMERGRWMPVIEVRKVLPGLYEISATLDECIAVLRERRRIAQEFSQQDDDRAAGAPHNID